MMLFSEDEIALQAEHLFEVGLAKMRSKASDVIKSLDDEALKALTYIYSDCFIADPGAEKFKLFREKLWKEQGLSIGDDMIKAYLESYVKEEATSERKLYSTMSRWVLDIIRDNVDSIDSTRFEASHKAELKNKDKAIANFRREMERSHKEVADLKKRIEKLTPTSSDGI